MFRDSITGLSSRKKMIMLASVGVLLPVLLLTFMQYRSLVELENKTKGAVKENLRQTLLNIEHHIEGKFEDIASQSLLPIAGISLASGEGQQQLEKHFSSVKQAHPEIDQIFVFSYTEETTEQATYAYVHSDGFHKGKLPDMGNYYALHAFGMARSAQSFLDDSRKFLSWQFFCLMCSARGQPDKITFVFYPLTDVNSGKPIGFAGFSLNEKFVRNELLSRSLDDSLNSPDLAFAGSDIALSVTDENQREIYTNSTGQQGYIIDNDFSRPFSNWNIRIGFKDTDIESLARHGFWESLALTVLILAFLIFGIVLTLRATDREVSLAQAKSVFVSNVSHELKTPLSLIRLFAELLELGHVKNNDKKREYYSIIGDESRRLTQLIENILDFSKIEARRKEYNFAYGDIGEVVENVIACYQYQITSSGFELKTDIETNLPPVLIDRDAIAQAILNLLDNAVKYSAQVKEISIDVERRDSFLMIEIADRGLGVSQAEQTKIFEKFYRVNDGLIHNVKGSGLGLSLVKHIVEAHRGKVTVDSEPGKGSRFTISIPLNRKIGEQNVIDKKGVYKIAEGVNN